MEEVWLDVGNLHEHISPTWSGSLASAGFATAAIVTPYYRNGNILEYARRNPDDDYLNMICQAASAVAYIHSKGLVHGNICPVSVVFTIVNLGLIPMLTMSTSQENLCVADDGSMRLTDIGVNTLVRKATSRYSVPSNWMQKPGEELKYGVRTVQTDVYSFGSAIYSVRACLGKHDW